MIEDLWDLDWCRKRTHLQAWWREQDLTARPCTANMRVGDRFMLGDGSSKQFGFVARKVIVVGEGPDFPYFEWTIAGDIGGWFHIQKRVLPESFFWIPTIDQLIHVGECKMAEQMIDRCWMGRMTLGKEPLRLELLDKGGWRERIAPPA